MHCRRCRACMTQPQDARFAGNFTNLLKVETAPLPLLAVPAFRQSRQSRGRVCCYANIQLTGLCLQYLQHITSWAAQIGYGVTGRSGGADYRSNVNEPSIIDRLADTTSRRERDALDRDIVLMLGEFLAARSVTLYCLLRNGTRQWLVEQIRFAQGILRVQPRPCQDPGGLPEIADRAQWRECIEQGRPVFHTRCSGDSGVYFPVGDGSRITGVVEVELDGPMSAREVRLAEGLLRILRNQIALLDYGERDTLTGLLNRKTFESRFERLCEELPPSTPVATQTHSWLGMLDIDRFKSINDTYGHVFGDEVLLLVSQIMQSTLRSDDQLFRFGGEEFVVVLEGTDATGASEAFQRIRAAVERQNFPRVLNVTASLGFTALRRDDNPPSCVERADAALYFVKNNGRNAVRCFEELVLAGNLTVKDNTGGIELF
jgi:diguanylate cyclase (GGDEF)-like protein